MKKIIQGSILWGVFILISGVGNIWAACPVHSKIVGYLPMWAMPYTPDWKSLTHLCLAFGTVQDDGTVDAEAVFANRDIIGEAHKHGVKVLLSIGGGGSKSFSSVILDKRKRAILIKSLRKHIDDLDLDGIDVDYEEWEGGSMGAGNRDLERREALETFYRELRAELGSHKLIAAAVNASWDNGGFGTYNCFNNSMHQYLDFVSLMIYDKTGPWSGTITGSHSDWDFFTNAIYYWLNNRKLPKEKLIAGVPFYGYKFSSRHYANDALALTYKQILELYPEQDAHLKDSIGLLYYDGMPTIRRKAEYVKEQDLGGIMFWEMTQDTKDTEKSLLNQIYEVLKK